MHFSDKLTLAKITLPLNILFSTVCQARENIIESDSENMKI